MKPTFKISIIIESLAAVGVKGIQKLCMLLEDGCQIGRGPMIARVARALFRPKHTVFEDSCEACTY